MSKKVLIVLSEWGYPGEALNRPLEAFDQASPRHPGDRTAGR